jgi:NAD(P)-dependent dehydrogenase (short-subunit alcohol dehydrogenase family)
MAAAPHMPGRLENKTAVITGGCSGIGLATVELFIAEGARVIVADILAEEGAALQNKFPDALRFVSCDVTREADVANAIRLAVHEFGRLDITFNNAGAVGTTDPIEDMRAEQWERTMHLLLRGPMFGIKHSIGPMKAGGGGAIVNTASISGVSTSGPPSYCVAKAAVIQLSRVAALELAPHRIRVNSILPGLIPTPIFGNMLGMSLQQSHTMAATIKDGAAALQPIPRPGSPQDIAQACLFLASDASAFVTGTELRVDGGRTLTTQAAASGSLIAKAARQAVSP